MWEEFNRYTNRCTGCRHSETCSKHIQTGSHDEALTGCTAFSPATGALWL